MVNIVQQTFIHILKQIRLVSVFPVKHTEQNADSQEMNKINNYLILKQTSSFSIWLCL